MGVQSPLSSQRKILFQNIFKIIFNADLWLLQKANDWRCKNQALKSRNLSSVSVWEEKSRNLIEIQTSSWQESALLEDAKYVI